MFLTIRRRSQVSLFLARVGNRGGILLDTYRKANTTEPPIGPFPLGRVGYLNQKKRATSNQDCKTNELHLESKGP